MASPDTTDTTDNPDSASTESDRAMTEFYQLQRNLFLMMLGLTVIIFVSVWLSYSLNIALNYLVGAAAGLLYFRRLARDIEGLGVKRMRLGSGRLVIFIGIIVIATQLKELAILPVFLGFMTYKAAIIIYVVQTTLFSKREES